MMLINRTKYFLSEIWRLTNVRKSSNNRDLIDLYVEKDFKHHNIRKIFAASCLFEISETWNTAWTIMLNIQLVSTGRKKNLIKILGLFFLIDIETNPIKKIELKNNKINKNSKFDIF